MIFKIVRGEGGIRFFVRDCLGNEVEFVSQVKYAENGKRGKSTLYIGSVYMPTNCSGTATIQ